MTIVGVDRQIEAMTDEEAAQAKLIYAPDWPSEATSIEEIRMRTGTKAMSAEDFDRHFGSLPNSPIPARFSLVQAKAAVPSKPSITSTST